MTKPLTTGRVILTPRVRAMPASQLQRLEEIEARLIFEVEPQAPNGLGRHIATTGSSNDAQLLVACWNASRGDSDELQLATNGYQGAMQRAQDRWLEAGRDREKAERQRDELLAAARKASLALAHAAQRNNIYHDDYQALTDAIASAKAI